MRNLQKHIEKVLSCYIHDDFVLTDLARFGRVSLLITTHFYRKEGFDFADIEFLFLASNQFVMCHTISMTSSTST